MEEKEDEERVGPPVNLRRLFKKWHNQIIPEAPELDSDQAARLIYILLSRKGNGTPPGKRRLKKMVRWSWGEDCCYLCGYPMLDPKKKVASGRMHRFRATRDHVVPVCKGGTGEGNIRLAHECCNGNKGNKDLTEELQAEIKRRFENLLGDYVRKGWSPYL